MSENTYNITFQPDKAQLDQLKAWMIEENQRKGDFHHDISIITQHGSKNTLAIIISEQVAIGFVTWDIFKRRAYIAVAAVAVKHRKSGAGRFLTEALFSNLLQQGIMALYLKCASATSERFWRKMGFQKMPAIQSYTNGESTVLYKVLIPVQQQGVTIGPHIEVHEFGSTKKLCWPLNYKKGTNELLQPIITPVSGDWCIAHVTSVAPGGSEKIKNFRSGSYFDDPFLIITNL